MPLDELKRGFQNAYASADMLVDEHQKAGGVIDAARLFGSDLAVGNLGRFAETSETSAAKEQYRHLKGDFYSAVRIIANRISGQHVVVARIGKPKNKSRSLSHFITKGAIRWKDVDRRLKRFTADEIEMVPDHQLLDVLENPNELMLESTLWLVSVANLLVTGRCLWLIDPDPKRPEILPIPTTWASPIHDVNGKKLFARWSIKPPNSSEKPLEVDGDFVANFYFPDPEDPFGCISTMAMLGDSVLANESIKTAQRVAFNNEINPTTAITIGEAVTGDGKRQMKLTADQRKTLITWLRQEFAGAKKFGLPIILDAIIRDIKVIGNKPKEIGFLESGDQTQKQIFLGMGVPLSSAGVTEGANYGSSGVADHTLIVNAVGPICKMFSEGITAWVLPHFNKGNKQKTRAWIVIPEAYDPDLKIRLWANGRQLGCYTRNDYRVEMLGLPPVEGWDDVLVQAAMRSVEAGEKVEIATTNPGKAPPNAGGEGSAVNGPPNDGADNENMHGSRQDQQKAFAAVFTKTVQDMWLKVQGEKESSLASVMQRYFTGQMRSAVIALKERGYLDAFSAADLASELLPVSQWTAKLRETLEPILGNIMLAGAGLQLTTAEVRSYGTKGILIDVPASVRDAIQNNVDVALSGLIDKGLWKDVNETTKRDLSFVIQEGLTSGDTVKDLANRIEREMGPEWSGKRADLVARTESGSALNAGHYQAQKELEAEGLSYGQEWSCMLLPTSRDHHVEMDGQKIRAGEQFNVAGNPALYPGDPQLPAEERCGCLCLSLPIMEPFEAAYVNRLTKFTSNGHAKNGHANGCSHAQ